MSEPDLKSSLLLLFWLLARSTVQTNIYFISLWRAQLLCGFSFVNSLRSTDFDLSHLKTNVRPPSQPESHSKYSIINFLSLVGDTPNILAACICIVHWFVSYQNVPHIDCYLVLLWKFQPLALSALLSVSSGSTYVAPVDREKKINCFNSESSYKDCLLVSLYIFFFYKKLFLCTYVPVRMQDHYRLCI